MGPLRCKCLGRDCATRPRNGDPCFPNRACTDLLPRQEAITAKKVKYFAWAKCTAEIARWTRRFLYKRLAIHIDNVVVVDESGFDKAGVSCRLACARLLTPTLCM